MKFFEEKKAEGIRFLDARENTALRIKLKNHQPVWYWATSFGWVVMGDTEMDVAEEALREYDGGKQ